MAGTRRFGGMRDYRGEDHSRIGLKLPVGVNRSSSENSGESPSESPVFHSGTISVPINWVGVRGDEDPSGCTGHSSSSDFQIEREAVEEPEEERPRDPSVELVEDNILRAIVPVPPIG